MTYLSDRLQIVMSYRRLTSLELAEIVGISRPAISRIMNGQRPKRAALRALCTRLPWATDGVDILIAHLKDEVKASGRLQTDVYITSSPDLLETDIMEHLPEDLKTLADAYGDDSDLRAMLRTMAHMLRRQRLIDGHAASEPTGSTSAQSQ